MLSEEISPVDARKEKKFPLQGQIMETTSAAKELPNTKLGSA